MAITANGHYISYTGLYIFDSTASFDYFILMTLPMSSFLFHYCIFRSKVDFHFIACFIVEMRWSFSILLIFHDVLLFSTLLAFSSLHFISLAFASRTITMRCLLPTAAFSSRRRYLHQYSRTTSSPQRRPFMVIDREYYCILESSGHFR